MAFLQCSEENLQTKNHEHM